jgi:hypothetical protein
MFGSGCAIRIGILCLVVGLGLGYATYVEYRLGAYATKEPEEIRLQDLIARGPEGNPHVLLTDFELCDNFVYETRGGTGSPWSSVWVPIVPRGAGGAGPGQGLRPQRVEAILFSGHVSDEAQLERRCAVPRLEGLVTNRIMSLGSEERKLLAGSYPGTDFSRCIIFQEGRQPASLTTVFLLGGGSALCLAAGAGLIAGGAFANGWPGRAAPVTRRPRRRPRPGDEDEA